MNFKMLLTLTVFFFSLPIFADEKTTTEFKTAFSNSESGRKIFASGQYLKDSLIILTHPYPLTGDYKYFLDVDIPGTYADWITSYVKDKRRIAFKGSSTTEPEKNTYYLPYLESSSTFVPFNGKTEFFFTDELTGCTLVFKGVIAGNKFFCVKVWHLNYNFLKQSADKEIALVKDKTSASGKSEIEKINKKYYNLKIEKICEVIQNDIADDQSKNAEVKKYFTLLSDIYFNIESYSLKIRPLHGQEKVVEAAGTVIFGKKFSDTKDWIFYFQTKIIYRKNDRSLNDAVLQAGRLRMSDDILEGLYGNLVKLDLY